MPMKAETSSSLSGDLAGYEVLVAVCGGIAAYKTCEVVSTLVQRGAGVTVAMTKAARNFVAPLTFQTLCGRGVIDDLWSLDDPAGVQHITPAERADLFIIAPATANMMGKIAAGIADDLVSTLAVCAHSPIILAPAMNNKMWSNAAVQANFSTLKSRGLSFVGPAEGWLACRSVGPGRMAEPAEIIEDAVKMLKKRSAKASAPK